MSLMIALGLLASLLDTGTTAYGVRRYGPGVETNPLVKALIVRTGLWPLVILHAAFAGLVVAVGYAVGGTILAAVLAGLFALPGLSNIVELRRASKRRRR